MTGNDAARQAQVQAGQPSCWPRLNGASASASAAEMPATPQGSMRVPAGVATLGTRREASTKTSAPMGTLRKKMARQDSPSTLALSSSPPSTWPHRPLTPAVTPNQASARGRSSPGNSAVIMASTWGTMTAAARPWSRRAPTSSPGDCASPHSSEAIAKEAMPAVNIRR